MPVLIYKKQDSASHTCTGIYTTSAYIASSIFYYFIILDNRNIASGLFTLFKTHEWHSICFCFFLWSSASTMLHPINL